MRYLVAGLASLILVWLLAPPLTPPLFDGLTGNVAPYRYLQPPPGTPKTPPPTSGTFTDDVVGGKSVEVYVTTKENPAQAIVALGDGALRTPPGTRTVIVSVRPVRPPIPVAPGILDGNVYLVGARIPGGGRVSLSPGAAARILLRKTGAEAAAVVEQVVAGRWARRPTSNFVNANYLAAPMTSLGYYALVLPNGAAANGPDYVLIAIGALIVLLVIGALIALRVLRRPAEVAA